MILRNKQCKKDSLVAVLGADAAKNLSDEELCNHPEVQKAVVASFQACAKAAKLTGLETVVGVMPLLAPWDPVANGCLTATQKIVPQKIFRHNAKELEVIKQKGIR
jgi:long-chain acyl-CoA synthetase